MSTDQKIAALNAIAAVLAICLDNSGVRPHMTDTVRACNEKASELVKSIEI